jgi:hypothetical protein
MHSVGILLGSLLCLPQPGTAIARPALPDTTTPRAESPRAGPDAPHPSVAFDFGAGTGDPLTVRTIELSTSRPPTGEAGARPAPITRVKVVRTPDTLSATLARRVATGELLNAMDVRLPGGSGSPALLVHLRDVRVSATRLLMSDDTLALAQQRLSLDESITQLTVDLAEARRQFGVAEQLEKQRLSPSMELARVRGTVEALTKRLATQLERRAMVVRQLARWTPVQEELLLEAGSAEVEAIAP